jgi:hypothetical protein
MVETFPRPESPMDLFAQAVQINEGTVALAITSITSTLLAIAKMRSDSDMVKLKATVATQTEDIAECRKDRDELRGKLESLIARYLPGTAPAP